jgi:hypothetical protein
VKQAKQISSIYQILHLEFWSDETISVSVGSPEKRKRQLRLWSPWISFGCVWRRSLHNWYMRETTKGWVKQSFINGLSYNICQYIWIVLCKSTWIRTKAASRHNQGIWKLICGNRLANWVEDMSKHIVEESIEWKTCKPIRHNTLVNCKLTSTQIFPEVQSQIVPVPSNNFKGNFYPSTGTIHLLTRAYQTTVNWCSCTEHYLSNLYRAVSCILVMFLVVPYVFYIRTATSDWVQT